MENVYYIMSTQLNFWTGDNWSCLQQYAIGMAEDEAHNIIETRFKKMDPKPFVISMSIKEHLLTTRVPERMENCSND